MLDHSPQPFAGAVESSHGQTVWVRRTVFVITVLTLGVVVAHAALAVPTNRACKPFLVRIGGSPSLLTLPALLSQLPGTVTVDVAVLPIIVSPYHVDEARRREVLKQRTYRTKSGAKYRARTLGQ